MEKNVLTEADFKELQTKLEEITSQLKSLSKHDPLSEKWLDKQDVCLILKISTRTLQTYSDKGILPFCRISNKIYYKASDIEKHLEKNYVKVW